MFLSINAPLTVFVSGFIAGFILAALKDIVKNFNKK